MKRFLASLVALTLLCTGALAQYSQVAPGPNYSTPSPQVDLDFAQGFYQGASLAEALAVTNSTGGYVTNYDGTWTLKGANTPRIGVGTGLLVEETRTNSIRNNSMQGAAAGTPGTLPTNWSLGGFAGLTTSVVGTGTESGIDYIDISFSGTTSGTFGIINFETGTGIAAVTAQTWAESVFASLTNKTNISSAALIQTERTSGGVQVLQNASGGVLSSIGTTLAPSRLTYIVALSGGGTTAENQPSLQLNWSSGVAVSATIRIGWPQLELGAFVTSPIRTTTASVARSADVVNAAGNLLNVLNTGIGTMTATVGVLEGYTASSAILSANSVNQMMARIGATNTAFSPRMNNVTNASTLGSGSWGNSLVRVASSWDSGNNSGVANNGTLTTSANGLTVSTPFGVGNSAGGNFLNGTILRLQVWNVRLPDNVLPALTDPLKTPTVGLDFSGGNYTVNGYPVALSSLLTNTNSTGGYVLNGDGSYTSIAANLPRVGGGTGLLVEETRTNSIRNNSMQGAAAGTPGTLPTNWSIGNAVGLTTSVIGSGTDSNGIDYVDLRFNGTANATTFALLYLETSTGIVATTGQTWTASFFWNLQAGTFPISAQVGQDENTSSGVFVASDATSAAIPTNATLTSQRINGVLATVGGGTVARVRPYIKIAVVNSTAYDFTIRIGWPQLELGAFVTSPIRTTNAAVARSADVVTMPWSKVSASYLVGTIITQFSQMAAGSTFRLPWQIDNGSNSTNVIVLDQVSTTSARTESYSGGSGTNRASATINAGSVNKVGAAWQDSDWATVANNGSVGTNAVAGIPTILTPILRFGAASATANYMNSTIQSLNAFSYRVPNAPLQAGTQ